MPASDAVKFTEKLLDSSEVELAGLAARDSLRIEAGLCLYGHDLNEEITPVEAALSWLIGTFTYPPQTTRADHDMPTGKDRRHPDAFIGSATVLQQLQKGGEGPQKRRVGFTVQGAPARENARIFAADTEEQIGALDPCLWNGFTG